MRSFTSIRGLATHKNARELADKLNGALNAASAGARQKLGIVKIEAESDEILRIELAGVNGDYRDEAIRILGGDAIRKHLNYYSRIVFSPELFRVQGVVLSGAGFVGGVDYDG